jgi:hypothetical protein
VLKILLGIHEVKRDYLRDVNLEQRLILNYLKEIICDDDDRILLDQRRRCNVHSKEPPLFHYRPGF